MPESCIYVAHTREQNATARRLMAELTAHGYVPAGNRFNVPVGKRIQPFVEQAMATAARCIICFSAKPGGPAEYDADDLLLANERLRLSPADDWLIPVKLTPCSLPAVDFGGHPANELAAVELHDDWNLAFEQLLAALPRPPHHEDSAPRSSPPAAAGRASMGTRIQSMQAKDVDFSVRSGDKGVVDSTQEIGTLTSDGRVSFRADNG